jgi:hypothetical protein
MKITTFCTVLCLLIFHHSYSQQINNPEKPEEILSGNKEDLDHRLDQLSKQIDDVLWHENTGDIAIIDKLFIYGPPAKNEKNPTAMGAGNPVKFWTYVFFPRDLDISRK